MATILLAGGTGLIGSVVLETALASSRVAKVYSLQRRHLPDNHIHKKNIKLRELVLQDPAAWTAWPSEVRDQLKSVDGCIWCLGVNPSKDKDPIETRTVNVEFTTHALKTLLALRDDAPPISVTASSPRPPLRFVYISAIGTVQDQQAQLWWLPQYRRTRGLVETELLSILDSQTAKDTAEGNQSPKLELGMTRIFVAWRSNWSFINATFVPLMETIGIINHPVGKLSKQLLKLALDGSRQPIYGVREVMALPTE